MKTNATDHKGRPACGSGPGTTIAATAPEDRMHLRWRGSAGVPGDQTRFEQTMMEMADHKHRCFVIPSEEPGGFHVLAQVEKLVYQPAAAPENSPLSANQRRNAAADGQCPDTRVPAIQHLTQIFRPITT